MKIKMELKERKEMEWLETPLQTLLGFSSSYLQTNVRSKIPTNKPWVINKMNY